MTLISLHGSALGAADLTRDVCLIVPLTDCLALDLTAGAAVRSPRFDSGANKRPSRPVLRSTSQLLAPPAHSIRVPIHIARVSRG